MRTLVACRSTLHALCPSPFHALLQALPARARPRRQAAAVQDLAHRRRPAQGRPPVHLAGGAGGRPHRHLPAGCAQAQGRPRRRLVRAVGGCTRRAGAGSPRAGPARGPICGHLGSCCDRQGNYALRQLQLASSERQVLTLPRRRRPSAPAQVDQHDVSRHSASYVGKLRSNFIGTEFVAYDGGSSKGGGARGVGVPFKGLSQAVELTCQGSQGVPLFFRQAGRPPLRLRAGSSPACCKPHRSAPTRVCPPAPRSLPARRGRPAALRAGRGAVPAQRAGHQGPPQDDGAHPQAGQQRQQAGGQGARQQGGHAAGPVSGAGAWDGGAERGVGACGAAQPALRSMCSLQCGPWHVSVQGTCCLLLLRFTSAPLARPTHTTPTIPTRASIPPPPGRYKSYSLSSCVVLRNKPPRWNQAMSAYCLNFGGRVTQASVKNFQLVSVDNMVGCPGRGGGGGGRGAGPAVVATASMRCLVGESAARASRARCSASGCCARVGWVWNVL